MDRRPAALVGPKSASEKPIMAASAEAAALAINGGIAAFAYLVLHHLQSAEWDVATFVDPVLFVAVSCYLGSRTQYMVERMDFLRAELRDLHEHVRSAARNPTE